MIGYMCLNERKMDSNHIRYEIGKIYKNKIRFFSYIKRSFKISLSCRV